MRDLYEILGMTKDTFTKDKARSEFRKRSKQVHPDANGGKGSPEEFHALTIAYQVLTDDSKKKAYDETGSIDDKLVDNIEALAIQNIFRLLTMVINDEKAGDNLVAEGGLFQFMEHSLATAIQQTQLAMKDREKKKRRIEKMLKLSRHKGKGTDHVRVILTRTIQEIDASISQVKTEIKGLERTCEIIYEYEALPDLDKEFRDDAVTVLSWATMFYTT